MSAVRPWRIGLFAFTLFLFNVATAQTPSAKKTDSTTGSNKAQNDGDQDDPTARLKWEAETWGKGDARFRKHVLKETARHNRRTGKRGHGASALFGIAPDSSDVNGSTGFSSDSPASGPQWIPVGPFDSDYAFNGDWLLGVVDSGRIRTILPHPTDPDKVFLLTSGGGLWKTSNFSSASTTWVSLTDNLPTTGGGAMEFGRTPDVLYLGLGDPFDTILVGGSVTKSTDGGENWGPVVELGTAISVRDLKVDTSGPIDVVLVATEQGLYRSADGGVSFLPVSPFEGLSVWSIVRTSAGWLASAQPCPAPFSPPGTVGVFCTTSSTLYSSTDTGATWAPITNTDNRYSGAGRTTLAVAIPGESVVYAYASLANEGGLQAIYKSVDGGQSWFVVTLPTQIPVNGINGQARMNICNGQCYYDQMILIDPTDESRKTVYIGGNLASAKTSDGGTSWKLIAWWLPTNSSPGVEFPYVHGDYHTAVYKSTGTPQLLFGTDGGLFVGSADGSTWSSEKNKGLQTHLLYTITGNPKFPNFAMVGLQDNGTRARAGATGVFNQINGGDGMGIAFSQANTYRSVVTAAVGSYSSDFSGVLPKPPSITRTPLVLGTADSFPFLASVVAPPASADSTGKNFFATTNFGVYKPGAGITWTRLVRPGVTPGIPAARSFRATGFNAAISPADVNRLALGGSSGFLDVSIDGGATWTDIFLGSPTATGAASGYQASFSSAAWADNNTLWISSNTTIAGATRMVKGTVAEGASWSSATWEPRQNGLPDLPINKVLVDPRNTQILYAATHVGMYRTIDGGANWSPYGTGLPNVRVADMYMPPDGGYLRIATYGRGVWEIPPLEFVSAVLTEDAGACDHDGVLDNGETAQILLTVHNQGSTPLTSTHAVISSNNPHFSFPSGNAVFFPTVPGYGEASASVSVALNGAAGIETAQVTMQFTDDALTVDGPVNYTSLFRLNYDEKPASSSTETFDSVAHGWTTIADLSSPTVTTWERREIAPLQFVFNGPETYSLLTAPPFPIQQLVSPTIHVGDGPLTLSIVNRYSSFSTIDRRVEILGDDNSVLYSNRLGTATSTTGFPAFITTLVTPPSTIVNRDIKIRFTTGDDVGNGWDLDEITVGGATSAPFTSIVPDAGQCAINTIDFGTLGDKTYGDADFTISASATSTLQVNFAASGKCSVTGTTVHISGAGTCAITASQAGNASYPAATDVEQTLNIHRANALFSITGYDVGYDGAPHTATGTASGIEAVSVDLTGLLDLSGTAHTSVGTYNSDPWTFAGNDNYAPSSGSVNDRIGQATPVITWPTPSDIVYGTSLSGTQLNASANTAGTFVYSPASGVLNAGSSQTLNVSFTPTDTANYNSVNKSVFINVLQATPTLSVTNSPVSFNGGAQSANVVSSVSGAVGNVKYNDSSTAPINAATYAVAADFASANLNYKSLTAASAGSFQINPVATKLVWTGATVGSFGDCAFNYQAQLLTASTSTPIAGQSITFTIAGVSYVTTTGTTGMASVPLPLSLPTGNNAVGVSYAVTTNYLASQISQVIVVNPGQAGGKPGEGVYTGTVWALTSSSSSSVVNLTLSASIKDLSPCTVDIRAAKVTFAVRNSDNTFTPIQGATNLPVGLVNPSDLTVGTANTILQYNIGNNAGATLNVAVIVGGNYTFNNSAYDQLVTIAKPGQANSMVGGAKINLFGFTDPNGTYPIANGYLAASSTALDPSVNGYLQFSSLVTYNKSGSNPQGNITAQFNSKMAPDGVTVYPTYHHYLIKSTSISSLVMVSSGVEQFNAKAVVQDLTAGTSVDGGATLQAIITDGQFGGRIAADKLNVTLYNGKTGGLWFSSSWGPSGTGKPPSPQQKPIVSGSGNVMVQ